VNGLCKLCCVVWHHTKSTHASVHLMKQQNGSPTRSSALECVTWHTVQPHLDVHTKSSRDATQRLLILTQYRPLSESHLDIVLQRQANVCRRDVAHAKHGTSDTWQSHRQRWKHRRK